MVGKIERFECNFFRDKVIYGLGRAGATFLQGTWFYQIGFLLYNPMVRLELLLA